MTPETLHWHERGRQLRAMESMLWQPHALTRVEARDTVLAAFVALLERFPAGEWAGLVDLMAGGYLAEHLARGGTVEGEEVGALGAG